MAAQTVSEKLRLEKGQHELKLGKSFDRNSKNSFHTMRYDFKPASVDTNQESKVSMTNDGGVTVAVPHIQSSGTSHTVYKGNKRPLQKECVLIINHDTGEIALEKLTHAIQLKKTRQETHSVRLTQPQRPVTPIDKTRMGAGGVKAPMKPYPNAGVAPSGRPSPSGGSPSKPTSHGASPSDGFPNAQSLEMQMSSSSDSGSGSSGSSSDSDSDSDSDNTQNDRGNGQHTFEERRNAPVSGGPTSFLNSLSHDLRLSESSDSDSS